MSKKNNKEYKNREEAFRDYFESVSKIVYTLNLISDRNDMTRRLSNNINRVLGYDDDTIINDEKTLNNNNDEIAILIDSIKKDLKKIL